MNTRFTSWLRYLALVLLVAGSLQTWAQLDTGRIVGTVKDSSGAVVTKATVKVTNVGTGKTYEVTTNEQGEYVVPTLPAGRYQVDVSQPGFKTSSVTDIVLYATDVKRTDVMLPVQGAAEAMTVRADMIAVNTQTSELGATIDANRVTNLPLNGRDFTSLIALVPGSVTAAGFGQTSLGGFETGLAGVNILLDGADATRIDVNATSTQLGRQESRISRASVDSIREFKVLSSTYSAEYGRSMGDVVNVITKSGTNDFHGTVFEYFRNNALDARNYFALDEIPLRLNQFGGNLAGPIVKDKVFFFVNYEGVRQRTTTPVRVEVLDAATRALAVPLMQPVIDAIPLGNGGPVLDPLGGPTQREYFNGTLTDRLREDTGSVKVDINATANDSLFFRYNIADSFTENQYGVADGQISPNDSRNHLFKATWTHTFSGALLNEAGFAFNRPQTDSLGGGGDVNVLFQCSSFWGCNINNNFGLAPGPALFSQRRPQKSYQFLDTLTWVKGRHTLKFGADIRRAITSSELEPQRFLSFDNANNFVGNNAVQLSTLGYEMITLRNTNWGFFAQDDIRVHPRFTLNLGLRYEYNSVLSGERVANFDVTTFTLGTAGEPLYEPDRNNFAPRIGFSWDVFGRGKTVVRSGFGVFYSPLLTGAALSLGQNTQQGFNINFIDLLFGLRVCDAPLSLGWGVGPGAYPVPDTLPSCTPPLPVNVNGLDRNMRDTYSLHWSFGVQQEVLRDTVLEVAYVGNRGLRLPAGAAYAGMELNFDPFGGVADPAFGNVRRLGNYLSSQYNAMQVSLRRRVGKGFNVDANYTWAHEFDNAVNIFNAFQNSQNPSMDWSEGDIDVRHNFTLGLVWDIPVSSRLPRRLAEGWQISSLWQMRGGLPYTIALDSPFLGIDQIRPNFVPGVNPFPDTDGPFGQINRAAFVAPPAGEYGNVPRNFGRGPAFNQIDLSIAKTTALTERVGLQFRVEAFNLFNRPNFMNPVSVLSSSEFGNSRSTVSSKVGSGTSRQLQLVTKLTF